MHQLGPGMPEVASRPFGRGNVNGSFSLRAVLEMKKAEQQPPPSSELYPKHLELQPCGVKTRSQTSGNYSTVLFYSAVVLLCSAVVVFCSAVSSLAPSAA